MPADAAASRIVCPALAWIFWPLMVMFTVFIDRLVSFMLIHSQFDLAQVTLPF
jgi:hypothetical protein